MALRRVWSPVAMVVVALLLVAPALAETLRGRVVGVSDGDTIRLLVDGRQEYRIRLGEIDAPESGQPFGRASKRMLSDLVFGQTITARVTDVDRYGRAVAVLTRNGVNINAEMVRRGGAWAYRRYLSDQRYLRWEDEARTARTGLWGLQPDQIMAPWDWRAARRGAGRSGGRMTTVTASPAAPAAERLFSRALASGGARGCAGRSVPARRPCIICRAVALAGSMELATGSPVRNSVADASIGTVLVLPDAFVS